MGFETTTYCKAPGETITRSINWAPSLVSLETISSSSWVVESGLTEVADDKTNTTSSIQVSSGTAGTTYEATCTINTTNGNIFVRTIQFKVEETTVAASDNRVTASEVKVITGSTLDDTVVNALISSAHTLITTSGIEAAACHTAASLREVELWYSAHLVVSRQGQLKSRKIGPVEDEFVVATGQGVMGTTEGQQAVSNDCSGILRNLDGVQVGVFAAGGANQ